MDFTTAAATLRRARSPEDVFSQTGLKAEFRAYARLVHPDKISRSEDADLFPLLQNLYEKAEWKINENAWGLLDFDSPPPYSDDAGPVYLRDKTYFFLGEEKALDKSVASLNRYREAASGSFSTFSKYLGRPEECLVLREGKKVKALRFSPLPDQPVRIASKRVTKAHPDGLPPEHVAWIGSRLFAFSTFCDRAGLVHMGITPDTVHIVPETHGILLMSAYHATAVGTRLRTYSGRWQNWYPSPVFRSKIAYPGIDSYMVQRTLVWLLGDRSGNGTRLRTDKRIHPKLVDFLLHDLGDRPAFPLYTRLLDEVFGKRHFVPLAL